MRRCPVLYQIHEPRRGKIFISSNHDVTLRETNALQQKLDSVPTGDRDVL
ncbi:hypothetical protein CCP2SC5_130038 [Azospirillaceae bacterium]